MPVFRLYLLDGKQLITKREDFEAPNDDGAIDHARVNHMNHSCEIWELGRLVASISQYGAVNRHEKA